MTENDGASAPEDGEVRVELVAIFTKGKALCSACGDTRDEQPDAEPADCAACGARGSVTTPRIFRRLR